MKEMKEVVQRKRGGEKTEEEMERECVFVRVVHVCVPVSAGGRTSKSLQSKGCFAFF